MSKFLSMPNIVTDNDDDDDDGNGEAIAAATLMMMMSSSECLKRSNIALEKLTPFIFGEEERTPNTNRFSLILIQINV